MNELDYTTEKTAELLPVCEHLPEDRKFFEYKMSPDGTVLCKFFPNTGTYISLETSKIVASTGRPDFDGRAMAKKMHQDRRDAVIDGLAERALEKGIGHTPADMIKEIIKRQIDVATGDGRDATNASKFVLQVYDQSAGGSDEGSVAKASIELSGDVVVEVLGKLFGGVEDG
jgi:hypothetical protein